MSVTPLNAALKSVFGCTNRAVPVNPCTLRGLNARPARYKATLLTLLAEASRLCAEEPNPNALIRTFRGSDPVSEPAVSNSASSHTPCFDAVMKPSIPHTAGLLAALYAA